MLTNPRDAFRGQSRSPNIVTFYMLGTVYIVFSCAIVTLSLFHFKKLLWPWNLGQRSLKVIESGTILYTGCGFYRNFIRKTHGYLSIWDILIQKCWDLENRVRGPSRSLEISPFDRAHRILLTFYSNYGSISCRFWGIQCRKISCPWNRGQGLLKVIESGTIRQIVYGFLLVFISNFVPKTHRFWDIQVHKCRDLENRVRVCQGHWKCHRSIERIWLPIDVL